VDTYCRAPRAQRGGLTSLLERNGERVWIEAVAATNGELGRPDSLVEPRHGGQIPEPRIVLRYTTAIREKYRKYLCYLRRGIIDKDDAYVVAINASRLAYRWALAAIDLPRFLKALYPIGELEVLIDVQSLRSAGVQHRPRYSIVKANKSLVPVLGFIDRRWRGITAVLCSDADAGLLFAPLGCDFEIAYNPLCRQPIARGVIPVAREWWSVSNDTDCELYCDPERS
jgi:hypothetical protein